MRPRTRWHPRGVINRTPPFPTLCRPVASLIRGWEGDKGGRSTTDVVIGRDRELAAIEAFLTDLGGPRALVIDGAAGIGKTTLWRAAIERAREHALVLACRPVEAETSLAFAGLIDLLDTVDAATVGRLPEPQRAALEVALLRRPPTEVLADPLAVAAGMRSALAELARRGPVIVAIDDVQWLDDSSAGALAYVVRRLTSERIGLLLAARSDTAPHGHVHTVATEALDTHRIRLDALSLSSLHHIVRARTGLVLSRPVLHRIAEASRGNALFAIELAMALQESGARPRPGEPLPMPDSLADLVAHHVRRVPTSARRALLVTATLGSPTAELVDRAMGHDAGSLLDAARDAGILEPGTDPLRFVHPLFAHAVVGIASPEDRRRAHAAVATVLHDPEQRARHLALASTPPDGSIAAALVAGAAAARRRGALRAAAELLEQALTFTPASDIEAAHRRAFEAAELYVLVGDRPHARELLDPLIPDAGPTLRSRAFGLLAEIVANEGHVREAERLLGDALESEGDPVVAARLELDLVYMSLLQLDIPAAGRHAARAARLVECATGDGLLAEALAMQALAEFLEGGAIEQTRLDAAIALEDPAHPPYLGISPRGNAALIYTLAGRHDEARTRFDDARAHLEALGDECDLAHVHLWTSWLETRAGRLERAAELAASAAAIADMTGSELLSAWASAQGALVEAHRGHAEATQARIGEVLRRDRGVGGLVGMWLAAAGGLAGLAIGDAAAAWRALRQATEIVEGRPFGDPATAFFVPDAAETLARRGEVPRARRLLERFADAARAADRPWAVAAALRVEAAICAVDGDLAAGLETATVALAAADVADMPLDRGRTLLLQGQLARRLGERRTARNALLEADAVLRAIGADGWAEVARTEARRIPGRRAGGDVLTASELRVAELAGAGRTNRDVAAALFVSPKTVEANLARVYRKLGITTRAELGAWLARGSDRGARR